MLSGGEKARLVMAIMLFDPPNLLVLDEPTNHLDLDTKEMLIKALSEYEGTMLFVSHDRHFLAALSNRVLELTPEGIHQYGGGYLEYVPDGQEAPCLSTRKKLHSGRKTMGDSETQGRLVDDLGKAIAENGTIDAGSVAPLDVAGAYAVQAALFQRGGHAVTGFKLSLKPPVPIARRSCLSKAVIDTPMCLISAWNRNWH